MNLCSPLAFTLLCVPAFGADVLVVDVAPGPGVDFTSIEAAVAAAADGDIVLVRPGSYTNLSSSAAVVAGKSLVLVADGAVQWSSELAVFNIGASQYFAMRGLHSANDLGMTALNCPGPVWIEDSVLGRVLFPADFENVDALALLRSQHLIGATRIQTSTSAVFDCQFEGMVFIHPGSAFDAALFLDGGTFFASGSSFVSEPSRDDIEEVGPTNIYLLDSVADTVPAGTVFLPGQARSYQIDATVREEGTLRVRAEGLPGDLVFVRVNRMPGNDFQPLLGFSGPSIVVAGLVQLLGVVPASGVFQTQVTMPRLPEGVEGRVFFSQGVFFQPATNDIIYGPGSMTVLLDSSL